MRIRGEMFVFTVVLLFVQLLTTLAQLTSLAMRPQGVSEEYLLLRYLLTNYSKVARPVARSHDAVLVLARLFPIKILNMYEKNEVLEITMRLQLTWRDRMLVWHAADFNNQSTIVIPGGSLWIPDLQIVNSVSDLYALLRDQKFDFKIHNDGSVWWHPTGNLVTRCELQLMYFPFDYQRCPIMLESAIYSHTQMNLTIRTDRPAVSLSMYAESGHWDLLKVTGHPRVLWVTNSTAFTRVEFWLYLGRKTTYFKMNIIFPCCMLSGLQMLTFFFPLESTERVPEATSILLSVIVFQTMIVDQLPRSSNSIPLLCIYVDMLTGISVLAVAEAVIVASLVSRKGTRTKAPKWAHGFLKFIYQWNSDEPQLSRWRSKKSSLAFLRSYSGIQNLLSGSIGGATHRWRKGSKGSNAIVLDNINASNIGANRGKARDNDSINSNEEAINMVTENVAEKRPPPNLIMINGSARLASSVKFMPNEIIDKDSLDRSNDDDHVSNYSTRKQRQKNASRPAQQMAFDAPMADFDPDSSLMMCSSVAGSMYQSSVCQLAPIPTLTCHPPSTTDTATESFANTSVMADIYSEDACSVDDSWQNSAMPRIIEPPTTAMALPSRLTQHHPVRTNSQVSAELSPLLAPRKIQEPPHYGLVAKVVRHDTSTVTQTARTLRPVASAAPKEDAQQLAAQQSISRASSYAASAPGRDGPRNSRGDFSILPGIPRQALRRSRPSLFIPAADSNDIILDWIYLAKVLDAVMFLICLAVVIVVPVVLFGILPPTTVE